MADLVAITFVIILIIAITLAAVTYRNQQAHLRRRTVISKEICVYAEREGEKPLYLGHAFTDDPQFTYQIEEVRSNARQQVVALNSWKKGWKVVEHSK